MSQVRLVTTPLDEETVRGLRAGDRVLLSGQVFTARDAAHKRLYDLLQQGKALPVDLRGQVIYYVGPTPARPGRPVGAAGPTTAGRMDAYAPALLAYGVKGMIGKGPRSQAVKEAIREHGAVYFTATAGAGALLGKCVVSADVIAYDDLGTEAIRRLTIEELPVVVVNDIYGGDLYEEGVAEYRR